MVEQKRVVQKDIVEKIHKLISDLSSEILEILSSYPVKEVILHWIIVELAKDNDIREFLKDCTLDIDPLTSTSGYSSTVIKITTNKGTFCANVDIK